MVLNRVIFRSSRTFHQLLWTLLSRLKRWSAVPSNSSTPMSWLIVLVYLEQLPSFFGQTGLGSQKQPQRIENTAVADVERRNIAGKTRGRVSGVTSCSEKASNGAKQAATFIRSC